MGGTDLPAWFHRGYLSLSDKPRAVYTLSAKQGLSHGEIAARLGISIGEVERHLADALIHLDRASQDSG